MNHHRSEGDDSSASTDFEEADQFRAEERDELKEVEKLSQRETTRIWIWKSILLVTILVAAALVTAGTFRILSDEEKEDFEVAYNLFANTVQDGLQFHFANFRLATTSTSSSITGAASAYGQSFPFVIVPDFELLGLAARKQSGIELITYAPFVGLNQTEEWKDFAMSNSEHWIRESRKTALASAKGTLTNSDYAEGPMPKVIWGVSNPSHIPTKYAPIWHMSPPPFSNRLLNHDLLPTAGVMPALNELRDPGGVFNVVHNLAFLTRTGIRAQDHEAFHASLVDWQKEGTNSTFEHPHCVGTVPVFERVNDPTSKMVGIVQALVAWDYYLVGLLPEGVKGITAVLENTCNQSFTYDIEGNSAFYRGNKDLHDASYDHMKKYIPFYEFEDLEKARAAPSHCMYSFALYPTKSFEDEHRTMLPMILAIVTGAAFFFMVMAFFFYDWFVQSRNKTVVAAAARATGIVSSMFPGQIRDQLLVQKGRELQQKQRRKTAEPFSVKFSNALEVAEERDDDASNVIADFFPETTVMFADIVGFTAWSSVREPCHVFQLLETLYSAFDDIAHQRRVFKVETVGDCYVAAAGLPEARKDHALAMARFARDCLFQMQNVLKALEIKLGPDTGELSMRFGLNSGPVTAGVLRGQRSRFQLFGDTMNTAARMESTGRPNMIQMSQDTAALLKAAGKSNWLTPRDEMIDVKGKGMMVTYWLNLSSARDGTVTTVDSSHGALSTASDVSIHEDPFAPVTPSDIKQEQDGKTARLVQWNVEIVSNILRLINAQRPNQVDEIAEANFPLARKDGGGTVLDEVREVVALPSYSGQPPKDTRSVKLKDEVVQQVHDYVTTVASMYRNNPFHNFEHASHVTMATVKLLSRVVNPKIDGASGSSKDDNGSMLHDYTYGITSDPLTQLACVFSAIIHDVDHSGVPNAQLIKENAELAQVYKRSIAEQNSFDLAWRLFMEDQFASFRKAVCKGPAELARFRQLVVNLVMATDIMDTESRGFRNLRWEKAFGTKAGAFLAETQKAKTDRKATIVIEHMIQASDVAHTMQHWHIYRKWNRRLFLEMYDAYTAGRAEKDPAASWYEGEIGFFDFYIIPLAKKLAECGVFGVASSEYLDYALRNRKEWESRGREVVAELVEEAKALAQQKLLREAAPLDEVMESFGELETSSDEG